MKTTALVLLSLGGYASGFSMSMTQQETPSRRNFLQTSVATAAAVVGVSSLPVMPASAATAATAAPEIKTTASGLKYAVTKQPADLKKAIVPAKGDVVAIEYTGYLTDGSIFDGTHGAGKRNVLSFRLGEDVIIEGLTEMLGIMGVGQKVQVIVPPKLAFGEKGLCIETGECLIKPGATLVYDLYLKQTAIPPP